jgi:hypothetical protein
MVSTIVPPDPEGVNGGDEAQAMLDRLRADGERLELGTRRLRMHLWQLRAANGDMRARGLLWALDGANGGQEREVSS